MVQEAEVRESASSEIRASRFSKALLQYLRSIEVTTSRLPFKHCLFVISVRPQAK